MKHEYAFDAVINAAVIVRADSIEEALAIARGMDAVTIGKVKLDCGNTIDIAEASAEKVDDKPYRIDGVDVEAGQTLQRARDNEVESTFNMYRFPYPLADRNGWEYTTPGDEMRRVIFLEVPDANDSVKATFVVRFEHNESAIVSSADIEYE